MAEESKKSVHDRTEVEMRGRSAQGSDTDSDEELADIRGESDITQEDRTFHNPDTRQRGASGAFARLMARASTTALPGVGSRTHRSGLRSNRLPRASVSAYIYPRSAESEEEEEEEDLQGAQRRPNLGADSSVRLRPVHEAGPVPRRGSGADEVQSALLPSVLDSTECSAGRGTTIRIPEMGQPGGITEKDDAKRHQLGQFLATAISGNDITSSCLYVAGISAYYAGKWAPVSLLLVAVVLFFYRRIYTEVVGALPINGGTYTALLNTTSKQVAAVAACLTMLSYIATAVVSAASAASYFHSLVEGAAVGWMTIAILAVFALLSLLGLSESAPVAGVIFVLHMCTLVAVVVDCFVYACSDGWKTLATNWATDLATIPEARAYGVPKAIFFGMCAAMLGISGFETSSNFVEEQRPGVFPKTLRNMWVIVSVLNPVISLMGLSVLPIERFMGLPLVGGQPNNASLLSEMVRSKWLKVIVNIDAVLVLSGAVLTGYVGITGLARRMALDRCLPAFILSTNQLRGTSHWIILAYFAACAGLFLAMQGNLLVLGGIYTIAFLSVMTLFAASNLLLKAKRKRIKRPVQASVPTVLLAMACTTAALVGNAMEDVYTIGWFCVFFAAIGACVMVMFQRVMILRWLQKRLFKTDHSRYQICGRQPTKWFLTQVVRTSFDLTHKRMVFFVKDEPISVLNKAIEYVRLNEQTQWLQFVHVYSDSEPSDLEARLESECRVLDRIYPGMRLDVVSVRGKFDRDTIDLLAEYLGVPRHFMFIACPGKTFPQDIASLGGVRIITY